MPQRDRDIALFVVWALNKAAKRWGTTPSEACRRLEAAGIASGHLVGLCDTARAMGERAILDDLSQLAAARGVASRFSAQADGRRGEMTTDERTIEAIEDVRLTHLEAQAVQIIAARMGLDAASALGVWYGSDLCRGVELNEFGLQYLDASYLVDELMAREGPRGGAQRRGGRSETGSLRPFPGKSDGRCPPFGR